MLSIMDIINFHKCTDKKKLHKHKIKIKKENLNSILVYVFSIGCMPQNICTLVFASFYALHIRTHFQKPLIHIFKNLTTK